MMGAVNWLLWYLAAALLVGGLCVEVARLVPAAKRYALGKQWEQRHMVGVALLLGAAWPLLLVVAVLGVFYAVVVAVRQRTT